MADEFHAEALRGLCCVCGVLICRNGHEVYSRVGDMSRTFNHLFVVINIRKEKKKYYKNLDLKNNTDNKQFWKTMKPLFTDNHNNNRKITLIDGEKIISNETEVAEIMNDFFSNAVSKLDIKGYKIGVSNIGPDKIYNTMTKFAEHPNYS